MKNLLSGSSDMLLVLLYNLSTVENEKRNELWEDIKAAGEVDLVSHCWQEVYECLDSVEVTEEIQTLRNLYSLTLQLFLGNILSKLDLCGSSECSIASIIEEFKNYVKEETSALFCPDTEWNEKISIIETYLRRVVDWNDISRFKLRKFVVYYDWHSY